MVRDYPLLDATSDNMDMRNLNCIVVDADHGCSVGSVAHKFLSPILVGLLNPTCLSGGQICRTSTVFRCDL